MSEQYLENLIAEMARNDIKIQTLEDTNSSSYKEVVTIVGMCALCDNWHYPHCEVIQE